MFAILHTYAMRRIIEAPRLTAEQYFYLCTVLYVPVLYIPKISLVLLYLRVWPFKSSFRTTCWAILTFLFAAFVAFQIVAIVQCAPIEFLWARYTDPAMVGTCIDQETWLWSLASTAVCVDLTVLLLPIPKLLTLKVPTLRKIG